MTRLILVVALLAVAAGSSFAAPVSTTQALNLAVNEVAMIGTGPTTPINLTIVAPATAGAAPANVSNNTNHLVYTSILPSAAVHRSVTAQMTGSAPTGTQLTLLAGADLNKGSGTVGTPAGAALVLSATAQSLITGVGSVYTGSANTTDGHILTYALEVVNVAALKATLPGAVTVTLTLTDAS